MIALHRAIAWAASAPDLAALAIAWVALIATLLLAGQS
jgi:hypothetical protein